MRSYSIAGTTLSKPPYIWRQPPNFSPPWIWLGGASKQRSWRPQCST